MSPTGCRALRGAHQCLSFLFHHFLLAVSCLSWFQLHCIYIKVATVTVVILCGFCVDGIGWVKRQNGGLGVAPVGAKSDASDMGSCYQFVAEDLWLCRRMRHRRRKQWHDGCVCLSMRLEPLFSFVLSNFSWSRLSYHRVIPQKNTIDSAKKEAQIC